MPTTKQVLRLQSDQTLDDPQVATRVRLKDLAATRAIQLVWVEPAASDWDVTLKDPTANDAIVYENLAQPLNNKTFTAPTISDFTNAQHDHTNAAGGGDLTEYARLPGRAGGQVLIGGSAPNEDLSLQSTSDATRGDIIAIDNITMGTGKEVVNLPAIPSGATAAASKAYVDASIAGGKTWKELLLTASQLDNTNDAIANAGALYLVNTAQIGDTFSITDGGVTEVWTFGPFSLPNIPAVGVSAADSMTDLALRINTDSTTWSALMALGTLNGINTATGNVIIIYRKVPTATTTDRIFGVFATPADAQFVDYGTEDDYSISASTQLPAADPTTQSFGIGRITVALLPNEAHIVRVEDAAYSWNQDNQTWTIITGGTTPFATSGVGGAIVGKVTADSAKGLVITGGPANAILETKVDGVTITHNGSGELEASGAAALPTGLVSEGILFTRDIIAVTPPTPAFISTDIPVLDYIDGSTTGQLFDFVVPADYDSGDIEILASYQMTTAAAGNVELETAAKIVPTTGAVDTATFPLAASTLTVPVTTDLARSTIKTLINPAGANFARGDTLQVYVKRLGGDANDTRTGSWRVVVFQIRYTGQINTRLMESVVEVFGPVSGTPSPPAILFATDVPVINFSSTINQAAAAQFVVPDNWDGTSDALFRFQYALQSAAAGEVRLNTLIRIVDVASGSVVIVSAQDYDQVVSADTDPHRTPVIRSVPGTLMSPGSVIQIVPPRDVSHTPLASSGFQVISATLAFGVAPTSGISSRTEYYLDDPVFGNQSGTVFAGPEFPVFGSDFELFYKMSSTAAAGIVHIAFPGRLSATQTDVEIVNFFVKGVNTGTVNYGVKVYAEGSGAAPVFTQVASTPPAASTQLTITGAMLSAQPTGTKRFFVVVESTLMENGESVSVGKPFVKVS